MSDKVLLVFGGEGQLGRALGEAKAPTGWRVTAVSRAAADITDADQVMRAIAAHEPAVVVNAAAYTAVDKAENDSKAAFLINEYGAGIVARAAAEAQAAVIHLSTDYVFDGQASRPWREDDPVAPLGVYGVSKEAGEQALRLATDRHVILRTSWVFAAHGHNFVRTMWRLGTAREELRVVDDQRGCPTSARSIAAATATVAGRLAAGNAHWGTFHFAGAPSTTWHGLADAVFQEMAKRTGRRPRLVPIATADYPTPARRPANSILDTSRIFRVYGIAAPDWRADLSVVLDEATAGWAPTPAGGEQRA
jgi:dTDP-4-dehydrorhamnose reductase